MKALKGNLKAYLLQHHPAWLAAFDYWLKPRLKSSFGGPFNGQAGRQRIFRDLLATCAFQALVETGAFRGTTTEFLARETRLPVWTVEAYSRYYHYARFRLRRYPQVHLELGDSRAFLQKLGQDPSVPKERVFFYLDSHWQEDLPLAEEIRLIAQFWRGVAVLIDDFQVPDDPGYRFDDYGPGKRLCLEHLPPLSSLGLTAFFPTLPSAQETGCRRGCVVLADERLAPAIAGLNSLRRG